MKSLNVGDTLYSLNVGDAARGSGQKLTRMTVAKVGRKYFWLAPTKEYRGANTSKYWLTKFSLEDWSEVSDYVPDHYLFTTPQEWEDAKEEAALCREIANAFEYGRNRLNLPLVSLRLIAEQIRLNGGGE